MGASTLSFKKRGCFSTHSTHTNDTPVSRNTAVQYDIVSANQAYCFAVHVRALLTNQLQGMNTILLTMVPN